MAASIFSSWARLSDNLVDQDFGDTEMVAAPFGMNWVHGKEKARA
jgi:hypothetical protein